jgi:hypothetical protein
VVKKGTEQLKEQGNKEKVSVGTRKYTVGSKLVNETER